MAPEQTRGAWREYGPWTDLYAVGCIAWEFVCGAPPFAGGSAFEIMIQHDSEERPPLEPEFPVPEGEGWIHRLMAIEPEERFPRAADTLRALRELERPETPSDREPESTSARLRALNRLGWAELKSWNLEAAATS